MGALALLTYVAVTVLLFAALRINIVKPLFLFLMFFVMYGEGKLVGVRKIFLRGKLVPYNLKTAWSQYWSEYDEFVADERRNLEALGQDGFDDRLAHQEGDAQHPSQRAS